MKTDIEVFTYEFGDNKMVKSILEGNLSIKLRLDSDNEKERLEFLFSKDEIMKLRDQIDKSLVVYEEAINLSKTKFRSDYNG